MPIYLPKKIVLNWYQHDATFSIDLMISFVDGIEKQAAHSIAKYQTKVSEDSNQVEGFRCRRIDPINIVSRINRLQLTSSFNNYKY